LSRALTWSVIRFSRASTTFWKVSGSRSKNRKLKQPTSYGRGRLTCIVRSPIIPFGQAIGDLADQLRCLQAAPGKQLPGLLLLQQPSQLLELAAARF
jgi:hypothetical protein